MHIYLNLIPAIERHQSILLNATQWTNCFKRKYLFHMVVKFLTRILYRLCHLETFVAMRKTSYDILLYLLFSFCFT